MVNKAIFKTYLGKLLPARTRKIITAHLLTSWRRAKRWRSMP